MVVYFIGWVPGRDGMLPAWLSGLFRTIQQGISLPCMPLILCVCFVQSGAPTRELSMLDRHEQKDAGAGDVWADPDDLNNLHGPRRFEGRCCCNLTLSDDWRLLVQPQMLFPKLALLQDSAQQWQQSHTFQSHKSAPQRLS